MSNLPPGVRECDLPGNTAAADATTPSSLRRSWEAQQGLRAETATPDWTKMPDVEYGDRLRIRWSEECGVREDVGLVVPWANEDELDANLGGLVWVATPANPGGKGTPPPEWRTLYDLAANPAVVAVVNLGQNERAK